MGVASTACTDWRWAEDAAVRSWIENAHTDLSDPDSWLDTNICLRFLLYNSGSKVETDGYRLVYSLNGGVDWNAVTAASSYVRSADSPNFVDGDSTSQEIGGGTFDEGYWDDDGSIASYDLANGQESEHEFCFQFRSADCAGETIDLRIEFDGGAGLDGYTFANPSPTFALGDVDVTPGAAAVVGAGVDPAVVLSSMSVTPGIAAVVGAGVDPAVVRGSISVVPGIAAVVGAMLDPGLVLSSMAVTPAQVVGVVQALDPGVLDGSGGVEAMVRALNLSTLGAGGRR